MAPEFASMLQNPPALAVLAGFLLVLGIVLAAPPRRRTNWYKKHRPKPRAPERGAAEHGWRPRPVHGEKPIDAADQLRVVMAADFTARPLLNQSEARVFEELCQIVTRCNPGWRVMAQVCLGEVLSSTNAEAFRCINSKRVDMLLIDEGCRPRHAIEYQGNGHYQGTAAARDAVKKEALRQAGIGYHEVIAGTTPSELRHLVERLVSKR